MSFTITKVKEPVNLRGINISIKGVVKELRSRQRILYNMKKDPCPHNILRRVELTFEISRLAVIKQELILIMTMKQYEL